MRNPLNLLLLLIPVALLARVLGWPAPIIFALSGLAIVPLAKWMGTATEELAVHTGPGVGGLLNATFGNATELIIAIFALQAGLIEVVKASITGSIVGNILFVLGLALLLGGLEPRQAGVQPHRRRRRRVATGPGGDRPADPGGLLLHPQHPGHRTPRLPGGGTEPRSSRGC